MAEKDIENAILAYLHYNKVFAWKNQSTGIYDPRLKTFRRINNPFHIKGVPDILGIFKGRPLAIEVKSKGNYPSPEQKAFMERFRANGGVCFIARSVDDVIKNLSEADSNNTDTENCKS